jgi:hypothetical protein
VHPRSRQNLREDLRDPRDPRHAGKIKIRQGIAVAEGSLIVATGNGTCAKKRFNLEIIIRRSTDYTLPPFVLAAWLVIRGIHRRYHKGIASDEARTGTSA